MNGDIFIGRNKELEQLNALINTRQSGFCLLYGAGGTGKSRLLEEVESICSERKVSTLYWDWKTWEKEPPSQALKAKNLWLESRVEGECKSYVSEIKRKPKHFCQLAGSLYYGKNPDWKSRLVFFLTGKSWEKLRDNPEKTLLEALKKEMSKTPLVLMIDDHHLGGQFEIETLLSPVFHKEKVNWEEKEEKVSLHEYLKRLLAFFSGKKGCFILLVAGRSPLPNRRDFPLSPQSIRLHAFHVEDIQKGLKQVWSSLSESFSEEEERLFRETALKIKKLTLGNPLLVESTLEMLEEELLRYSPEERNLGKIWGDVEDKFQKRDGKYFEHSVEDIEGFYLFVKTRIVDRIGENPKIQGKDLWKLSLPYFLLREEFSANPILEDILFPGAREKKNSPFQQLAKLGILYPGYENPSQYHLHSIAKFSLFREAGEHPSERDKLHKKLALYFEKDHFPEAAQFHQFCATARPILEELLQKEKDKELRDLTPEEFWDGVRSSLQIKLEDQEKLFSQFPPSSVDLEKALDRLREEKELLSWEDCSGDASLFLRQKFRNGQLQWEDLKNSQILKNLREENKSLSDLFYLQTRLEENPEKALARYKELTEEINSLHGRAWYERGMLELQFQSRLVACDSFREALFCGLTGHRRLKAQAQLDWFQKEKKETEKSLKKVVIKIPQNTSGQIAWAEHLLLQERNEDASRFLEPIFSTSSRLTFLFIEACFRIGKEKKGISLAENYLASLDEMDWEKRRLLIRLEEIKTKKENLELPEIEKIAASASDGKDIKPLQDNTVKEKTLFEKAYNLCKVGNYIKAEECLLQALKNKSDDTVSLNLLGICFGKQKKYREAEEAFQKVLKIEPDRYETWNNRGLFFNDQENYSKAEKAYQKALEIKPNQYEAWNNWGNCFKKQKHYDKAEKAYRKALGFNLDEPGAWGELGLCLAAQENYVEAEEAFKKALELKKDDIDVWINLGACLLTLEKYSEAENTSQKALKIKPDCPEAWNNLGACLKHAQKYTQAEECFQKTLEFKADFHEAWKNLGITSQARGEEALGKHFLQISNAILATRMKKASPTQWYLVSKEVWANHHFEKEAQECLQELFRIDPDHLDGLTLAAELALSKGKEKEAEEFLQKLESQQPEYFPAFFPLAQLRKQQGRNEEALSKLREFYDKKRLDQSELMQCSILFEELGDAESAKDCCYRLIDPNKKSNWDAVEQLVKITWGVEGNKLEARKLILEYPQEHPLFIDLLAGEMALETGDFAICRQLLEQIENRVEELNFEEKGRWEKLWRRCL